MMICLLLRSRSHPWQACYELEKDILRAMAVAFDLQEDYFQQLHQVADNQLRLLHYPQYVIIERRS